MATDPDVGTRTFTQFVRIEGGLPVAIDNRPNRWLTDSGQRPTDEWLQEQDPPFYGYIDNGPAEFDPATHKPTKDPLDSLTPDAVAGTVTQTWTLVAKTAAEIAADEEAARLKAIADEQRAIVEEAKLDGFIQTFVGYDATQVQNYVDTNVTDLASAKAVIKKLALICLALSKQTLSQ